MISIEQKTWAVQEILTTFEEIRVNPQWQRGPAWNKQRQALLIDSILRGLDIPKIYLLKLPDGGLFNFEAIDGQQRLRALASFSRDQLPLVCTPPLPPIEGHRIQGITFSSVHKDLQNRFLTFPVIVAEISSDNIEDVTELFSRLQMGVPLNAAELRNAIPGAVRGEIEMVAEHRFFKSSRISEKRYKRQDFAAHGLAILERGGGDIKAGDLSDMYRRMSFGNTHLNALMKEYLKCLEFLAEVNKLLGFKITQKWVFVDLVWLVAEYLRAKGKISPLKFAQQYDAFNQARLQHTGDPRSLLRTDTLHDRALADYILAFKTEGATRRNLEIRHKALRRLIPRGKV